MQKIKKLLRKAPLLTAAGVCFLIAAVIFVATPDVATEVKRIVKKATPTPLRSVSPSATQTLSSVTPTVAIQNLTNTTPQISQPTATAVPQPTSAPAKQTFQVTLSINRVSVGAVTLAEGANQCDVLTKAQEQGKISQLLMKYNDSLGTHGVYQINGIGKENTVWWVYTVNGQSPSQGCSYIKASSGDSVTWEYKG